MIDLSKLGLKISPLYLNLVKGMLVKDLNKRMDWSQFFADPVVFNEPEIYRATLEAISNNPKDYIISKPI